MNTKEFKVGDRIEFMAGEPSRGTVVQIRDYEPSLCVCWDEYVGKYWYITSSGVFQKIDDDISDEDKDLVTNIINNVNTMNGGLVSVEEITSAWRKAIKDLESEGELKLKDDGIKVGDRVECMHSDNFGILEAGEEGTVIIIEKPEPTIGVRWDNYHEEKHDLYGNCEDGYGFWISENAIKKIENSDESGELKIDAVKDKSIAEEIVDDFERMVQRLNCVEMTDENGNKIGEIIPLIGDNFGKGGFEEVVEVGDRVEYIHNCSNNIELGERGVVVFIDSIGGADIGVRFDKFDKNRGSLLGNCEKGYGRWVFKGHIKKIEDTNKNQVLSPKEMLKAGMVVEMADGDFGLFDGEYIIYHDGFDEIEAFSDDLQDPSSDEFSIVTIYKATCGYTLQNLDRRIDKFEVVWKKEGFKREVKKEFSKDELEILDNINNDGYEYIARNKNGEVVVFSNDVIAKLECSWYSKYDSGIKIKYVEGLFKCISWEDEEPTRILDFI